MILLKLLKLFALLMEFVLMVKYALLAVVGAAFAASVNSVVVLAMTTGITLLLMMRDESWK